MKWLSVVSLGLCRRETGLSPLETHTHLIKTTVVCCSTDMMHTYDRFKAVVCSHSHTHHTHHTHTHTTPADFGQPEPHQSTQNHLNASHPQLCLFHVLHYNNYFYKMFNTEMSVFKCSLGLM